MHQGCSGLTPADAERVWRGEPGISLGLDSNEEAQRLWMVLAEPCPIPSQT